MAKMETLPIFGCLATCQLKVRITRQILLLFVTIPKGRGRGTCEMYSGGLWCRFVKCYKKCFDLLISFSLSEFWIPKPFLPSPNVVIVLILWGCSRRHFRENLLIFFLAIRPHFQHIVNTRTETSMKCHSVFHRLLYSFFDLHIRQLFVNNYSVDGNNSSV